MHVSFALFADAANLSQEGKLNILGVFDAVQVGTLPTVHRRASLVVHLKGDDRDAGAHRVTLRWINPSGDELWNSVGDLEVQANTPNAGNMDLPIIAAVDLPLDQPGAYTMEIALDDVPSAAVPLLVRTGIAAFPAIASGGLVS